MENLAIDYTQTRAICDEIGERLRILLKSTQPDLRQDFNDTIDRLRDELPEQD
jgi:hypothetical protein